MNSIPPLQRSPDPQRLSVATLRALPFVLIGCLFALHAAMGIFVAGDAYQAYATFHSAYGNLLHAGELPQWLPEAAFGSPAGPYLLTFLGPLQLAAMLVGLALRCADAWLLFSISAYLEGAVYVGGAYLLGVHLFRREFSASMLACWVGLTLYWNAQVFWPHRVLLYVPWMLLFTLRLHRNGDPREGVRLGLALCLGVAGSLAYTGPLFVLLCCVFFLFLRLFDRQGGARLLRSGWPEPAFWLEALLLACLAGCYLGLFFGSLHGLTFAAPDRDPVSGANSLNTYLTYGGTALAKLPDLFTGHWNGNGESLIYLGASGAGLFLYALLRVRGGAFAALCAATLFLFLLSMGKLGLVAYPVYWFPGMNRFRHLSYLLSMVRLLVLVLAAWGVDHALDRPKERRAGAFFWALMGGMLLLFLKDVWLGWLGLVPEIGVLLLLVVRLSHGILARKRPELAAAVLGLALGGLVAFELCLAQQHLLHDAKLFITWPERHAVGGGLDLCRVRPREFAAVRKTPEESPRHAALRELFLRQPVNNFSLLTMVGEDYCATPVRIDYATPQVLALLERAAPGALAVANVERDAPVALSLELWSEALAKDWYREAVGCATGRLVLEGADGARRDASAGVREYSADRLTVEVDAGAGAELYYADAWHPGWRARVDGGEVPVTLARGAFKSVALPPGRHLVAFSFHSPARGALRWALCLLGCAALALLAAAGWKGRAMPRQVR